MRPLPPEVAAVFAAIPQDARRRLADIREMIFDAAAEDERVGALTETLKWGEPAYLTEESGSGSTVRLGLLRSEPECVAIFFNCRTTIVEDIRQRFGGLFQYEGRRAVLLPLAVALLKPEIERILAIALTYHIRR